MIITRTRNGMQQKLGEIKGGRFYKFIEFKKSFNTKYSTLCIEAEVLQPMLKHGVREVILTDIGSHRTFSCPAVLFLTKGVQAPSEANLRRMDPNTQKYWAVPLINFSIKLADGTEVKHKIIRQPQDESQKELFT